MVGAAAEQVVRAELVGNVLDVLTAPGRRAEAGEPLVLLESMKMSSEAGGTVSEVAVSVGDLVQEGDVLVVLR